jgi:hypothetical protein
LGGGVWAALVRSIPSRAYVMSSFARFEVTSAQRTLENSPALECCVRMFRRNRKPVKRAAEIRFG